MGRSKGGKKEGHRELVSKTAAGSKLGGSLERGREEDLKITRKGGKNSKIKK